MQLPKNEFRISEGRKVWVAGSVVIEGFRHKVAGGYIKCDSALNRRAWDVTEERDFCSKCFEEDQKPVKREFIQLSIFN